MVFVWIALGAAAIWATFIYAPSYVMYRLVFSRKPTSAPDTDSLKATVLAPYAERIVDSAAYLDSLSPERVTVSAPDGVTLAGRYWRTGAGRTVILFHGFSTHPAKNFAVHARLFLERGYDVLAVHERAHGESGGSRGGMGLLERFDVPLWIAKARELSPGCAVALYGMSMGAATVAYASQALDPAEVGAIVLDCGFSSPYGQLCSETRRRRLPASLVMPPIALHARIFLGVRLREDTALSLEKNRIPTLFMHGDGDKTVDVSRTRSNFDACASEKELLIVPGAAHTAALLEGGEDAERKLFDFLDAHLADKAANP